MKCQVYILQDAEDDILGIYRYVSLHDSKENAESLIDKIKETCASLETFPDRGHTPPELDRVGVFSYKETHFKPYRILYEIVETAVYVHCVLDSRRSLQELLEKRLLR